MNTADKRDPIADLHAKIAENMKTRTVISVAPSNSSSGSSHGDGHFSRWIWLGVAIAALAVLVFGLQVFMYSACASRIGDIKSALAAVIQSIATLGEEMTRKMDQQNRIELPSDVKKKLADLESEKETFTNSTMTAVKKEEECAVIKRNCIKEGQANSKACKVNEQDRTNALSDLKYYEEELKKTDAELSDLKRRTADKAALQTDINRLEQAIVRANARLDVITADLAAQEAECKSQPHPFLNSLYKLLPTRASV